MFWNDEQVKGGVGLHRLRLDWNVASQRTFPVVLVHLIKADTPTLTYIQMGLRNRAIPWSSLALWEVMGSFQITWWL